MLKLLLDALSGEPDALEGVKALVEIMALVPSAVIFVVGGWLHIQEQREAAHRYLQDEYKDFLGLLLAHPELGVAWRYEGRYEGRHEPGARRRLTVAQRVRRDVLFDLLTALFETAFLTYERAIAADRRRQWRGWADYMDHYFAREDYRDWWRRAVGDPAAARAGGFTASQFDPRFERHAVARMLRPAG
jgi:hypothetical protein